MRYGVRERESERERERGERWVREREWIYHGVK